MWYKCGCVCECFWKCARVWLRRNPFFHSVLFSLHRSALPRYVGIRPHRSLPTRSNQSADSWNRQLLSCASIPMAICPCSCPTALSWPAEVAGGTRVNGVLQFKVLLEQCSNSQHTTNTLIQGKFLFFFLLSGIAPNTLRSIHVWRCLLRFLRDNNKKKMLLEAGFECRFADDLTEKSIIH